MPQYGATDVAAAAKVCALADAVSPIPARPMPAVVATATNHVIPRFIAGSLAWCPEQDIPDVCTRDAQPSAGMIALRKRERTASGYCSDIDVRWSDDEAGRSVGDDHLQAGGRGGARPPLIERDERDPAALR